MVYRRRYFPALTITTISYAEKSITAEKLADGSVIHPKVAPDAIDSERVIDESLKSVDIKDGEIKTPDIQDGAITSAKILAGAVTPEKLSVSVLTRPISPGVNTAELLDANVTLAKLAPNSVNGSKIVAGGVGAAALAGNAVETAKVKDAQITLAKMAPDSIDNTVIKANTIRGTEIAPGAVSTGQLSADAAETVKIKDRNVTSPKIALEAIIPELIAPDAVTEPKLDVAALARRHMVGLKVRQREVFDEFLPPVLASHWVVTGDAGGSIVQGNNGLSIQTGGVNGNAERLDWGGVWIPLETLTNLPNFLVGIHNLTSDVYVTLAVGLYQDDLNLIEFYAHDDAGATANWQARCVKGGASSLVDTGITVRPGTGNIRLLEIDVLGPTSVKFYVDGVEKAHIVNPAHIMDERFELRLKAITRTGSEKYLSLDYLQMFTKRAASP